MALVLDGTAGIGLPTSGAITSTATIKSDSALPPSILNNNEGEIGTFCRAWVNWNGAGTVSIRTSFNVSSVTDNGVGDYTINMIIPMPSGNYATSFSVNDNNNNSINTVTIFDASNGGADPTTTSFRVATCNSGTTGQLDVPRITAVVFA